MNTLKILILLLMVSLPAMAAETMSGGSTKDDRAMQAADMRIILNTFTALAEEHLEGIQRSLKILPITEEARSGDCVFFSGAGEIRTFIADEEGCIFGLHEFDGRRGIVLGRTSTSISSASQKVPAEK